MRLDHLLSREKREGRERGRKKDGSPDRRGEAQTPFQGRRKLRDEERDANGLKRLRTGNRAESKSGDSGSRDFGWNEDEQFAQGAHEKVSGSERD